MTVKGLMLKVKKFWYSLFRCLDCIELRTRHHLLLIDKVKSKFAYTACI